VIDLCFGMQIECCKCQFSNGLRNDFFDDEKNYSLNEVSQFQHKYDGFLSYFVIKSEKKDEIFEKNEEIDGYCFEDGENFFGKFKDFVCFKCLKNDSNDHFRVYIDKASLGEDVSYYPIDMKYLNINKLVYESTTKGLTIEDVPEHGGYICNRCRVSYNCFDEDCYWDKKMKICYNCNKMVCKNKCKNNRFDFLINKNVKSGKCWKQYKIKATNRDSPTVINQKYLWFCDKCDGSNSKANEAIEELNNGEYLNHFSQIQAFQDGYYVDLFETHQDFELLL